MSSPPQSAAAAAVPVKPAETNPPPLKNILQPMRAPKSTKHRKKEASRPIMRCRRDIADHPAVADRSSSQTSAMSSQPKQNEV
jgi:hypothetical protein